LRIERGWDRQCPQSVKVVPEIAVSGDGSSGMANVMLAKLVAAAGEQKA